MPSAAYIAERDRLGHRVQWIVEIDLDRCSQTYAEGGGGNCQASDLGDGDRCWYTFPTCQDPDNFTKGTRTWRFCLNDVPPPADAGLVYPCLKKFVDVPQTVNPKKLQVYPSKVTLEFDDIETSPVPDHDKGSGAFNTTNPGRFWLTLLARNRNYPGRPLRILHGFYREGVVDYADFEQVGPDLQILEIEKTQTGVKVTAESPLAKIDKRVIPWGISEDNTVQTGINNSVTSVVVNDAAEYPDPTDFSRNDIFVRMESEICQVTAVDTGTDTLTITRAQWGTTAASHSAGVKVEHVVPFGVNNGASDPTGKNSMEVLQDLLEWADIDAADVDDTSFDRVAEGAWPDDDIYSLVTKNQKIAKLVGEIREPRGIIMFINDDSKWAVEVMGPDLETTELTDDDLKRNSLKIVDDDETRLTRVIFRYDPSEEGSTDPDDYQKTIVVVDTDSEGANSFNDRKEKQVFDRWTPADALVANVRSLATRVRTRLSRGSRKVTFETSMRYASIAVGQGVNLNTRFQQDAFGENSPITLIVTGKRVVGRETIRFEGIDLQLAGRFFRIGSATMVEPYDDAVADREFGYWGDSSTGRVGTRKEEGYRYF